MSYVPIDDGRAVIAKQHHRCEWCSEGIRPGDKCVQRVYSYDDIFINRRMHIECFSALTRWVSQSFDGEFMPDENVRGKTPYEEDQPKRGF